MNAACVDIQDGEENGIGKLHNLTYLIGFGVNVLGADHSLIAGR